MMLLVDLSREWRLSNLDEVPIYQKWAVALERLKSFYSNLRVHTLMENRKSSLIESRECLMSCQERHRLLPLTICFSQSIYQAKISIFSNLRRFLVKPKNKIIRYEFLSTNAKHQETPSRRIQNTDIHRERERRLEFSQSSIGESTSRHIRNKREAKKSSS